MFSQQRKKKRPYQSKKRSIQDENIDRQITAIHHAIALKLWQQQELIPQVITTIEQRKTQGRLTYGAYIHWLSVLETVTSREAFISGIAEDTPKMRKWRRQTPFVGILTEAERQQALNDNAMGQLQNVAIYF
ncbi:hypothetical protein C2869_07135 [Saccharobesus litoralis]|uniref:Uncharacterized protein n=1 Tax=Saccharobesus litoralis TaxID=2172099 RepID=A0A2S0VPW1_9ALTE|nr:hypothetical protein [Saccharobesus litoralis]AWB66222.1 hypothetical protein C2869_07135 [Saccharobesus litoralis]